MGLSGLHVIAKNVSIGQYTTAEDSGVTLSLVTNLVLTCLMLMVAFASTDVIMNVTPINVSWSITALAAVV